MSLLKYNQISQVKSEAINFSSIDALLKSFKISSLLSKKSIVKPKGIKPIQILFTLFLMLFQNKRSVSEALKHLDLTSQKTTVNDFLNNPYFKWRSLLLSVAQLFTKMFRADDGKYSVFIIDDTAKKKTGKFVESISYFYDHSADCYYRGYQVVIAAWSNLRTCIPLDIVLKTGKKRCKHSKRCTYPVSSHIYKRHLESRKSKTKIAVAMVKRALLHKIHFDYVLWDSWYNCSESYIFVFKKLLPKMIHLISMVKQGNELYKYGVKDLTVKELQVKAGVWNTDKDTGIKYKSLEVDIYDKTDKSKKNKPVTGTVKLCFYKFKTKGKGKRRCRVLLSTDINLTEMDVLERYTQRWSIEVMIKDLKQHMGFNQSMSSKYAPQLTDMTIKCIFYIMICSLKEREPEKSIGQLVFEFDRQVKDYCIELFVKYLMKLTFKEFINEVKYKKYVNLLDLIPVYDDFIDEFFSRDYIDRIVEVDNNKTKALA
jgi:hypothetical protein